MMTNEPNRYKQVFLGVSPYSLLNSAKSKSQSGQRYIQCKNDLTPLHHQFWGRFEYEMAKKLAPKRLRSPSYRAFELDFNGGNIILGQGPCSNIVELCRKFSGLHSSLDKLGHDIFSLKGDEIEKGLIEIWENVINTSSVESINFNKVFSEINIPIIRDIYRWFEDKYSSHLEDGPRNFIKSTSIIFMGIVPGGLSPIQLLYLLSKVISENIYFRDIEDALRLFKVDKDINRPAFIKTDSCNLTTSDIKNVDKIIIDNYDGKFYSDTTSIFALERDQLQLEKLTVLKSFRVKEKENNFSYSDRLYIINHQENDQISKLTLTDGHHHIIFCRESQVKSVYNDPLIEEDYVGMYILVPKDNTVSQITFDKDKILTPDFERDYLKDRSMKSLSESHFLGNIAALFYGH